MDAREATQRIMDSMVQERPASWPHGLGFHLFEKSAGDSVYLIKAGSTPVGFVGWQSRHEDGKRIGYYSVGLLPTYRGQGLAKEAVSQLIAIKSASVDEVRAIIQKDNSPSIHLADSLGVRVEKCATAMAARLLEGLGESAAARTAARTAVGAGIGAAGVWGADQYTGAPSYANPQAMMAHYAGPTLLGAIAAQEGILPAIKNYITPEQVVPGTGWVSDLIRPDLKRAPQAVGRQFKPSRALAVAAAPVAAYELPLAAGNAHPPISKLLNDWDRSYDRDTVGKNDGKPAPGPFDYTVGKLADKITDRTNPILRDLGTKATDKAMPILQRTAESAMPAVKDELGKLGHEGMDRALPMLKEYLQHAAVPAGIGMAGTAAGTGLGWLAGTGFYQDDKSKTPQERIATAKKQQTLKAILATLGGTVGGIGSMLPYYTGKATA